MQRLDLYLVASGKFENRSKVTRAIKDARVIVDGVVAKKAGQMVDDNSKIEVIDEEFCFVSRGGHKLQGAIEDFGINVSGVVALDIGSSTGGFCDCLLQNGAKSVIAVDVGDNQLYDKLRNDKRIMLFEQTDIRNFDVSVLKEKPTFACGDLSFISLENIIPSISKMHTITDVVLLIKPQFECGKQIASKHNGVIKDFKEHKKAIIKVISCLEYNNFYVANLAPSHIVGGSGNIEYLVYAKKGLEKKDVQHLIMQAIEKAKTMFKKGE